MSRRFVLEASLACTMLLLPVVVSAQGHGARGPVGAVPVGIPVHPMVMSAPAVRAPVQGAGAARPVIHSGVGGAAGVAPRNGVRPVRTKSPVHNHPGRTNPGVSYGSMPAQGAYAEDDYGVPGLGFDYPHHAAVHRHSGHAHFRGGGVVPFFGGGIYVPATGYVDAGAVPEAGAEEEQGDVGSQSADYPAPTAVDETPPASRARTKSNNVVPPSQDYIFVKKDGTVFFAVAYSWVNGNLQYVTQDGLPRLVSLSTLDLDATEKFNEQRGVAFHSPA